MLKKKIAILSVIMACVLSLPAVSVNAATQSTKKQSIPTVKSIIFPPQTTTEKSIQTVKITDFGAHSITEKGYENFDSSQAINKAIKYASENKIANVDFGSGKYYARDISLESNITYFSKQGAEIIASPDIKVWHCVLAASNKTNIVIDGLTVNGNKAVVFGNTIMGSRLIGFSASNKVTVKNCYLYNNWSAGILIQDNCNYVTIQNNKIYDTDCGILSQGNASNNLLIDANTIYGSPENQMSEPISIFNKNTAGLAHDITITNNIVHDKLNAFGILVVNATKVLIKGNTIYNCFLGINVSIDCGMSSSDITTSCDFTIIENNIYNCVGGIRGEINNSLISKNQISNLKGTGIWLATTNGKSLINKNTISNNTISNINSVGAQEPAIRLENTSNCIIDQNNVSDNRSKVLHRFVIQVTGKNSTNNIVRNNSNLGATVSYGYQIYIQNAQNTTVQNNIATLLDQGTGTKLINNKTK